MVHSVHHSCVGLWGFAWILQWVLTECRTPCSRYRSLGGSAPCSSSCLGVWFPLCGNGALLCPSSNGATQVSPPTIDLLRRATSNSSIWSVSALDLISSHLDVCHFDGVSSLLDVLSSRRSALTFVQLGLRVWSAFEVGVTGQMWHLMCHYLRDTQGRVLSPLLLICSSTPWLPTFGSSWRPSLVPSLLFPIVRWRPRGGGWIASTICKCLETLWQRGPGSAASNLAWDPPIPAHQTCAHLYSDLGRGSSPAGFRVSSPLRHSPCLHKFADAMVPPVLTAPLSGSSTCGSSRV